MSVRAHRLGSVGHSVGAGVPGEGGGVRGTVHPGSDISGGARDCGPYGRFGLVTQLAMGSKTMLLISVNSSFKWCQSIHIQEICLSLSKAFALYQSLIQHLKSYLSIARSNGVNPFIFKKYVCLCQNHLLIINVQFNI